MMLSKIMDAFRALSLLSNNAKPRPLVIDVPAPSPPIAESAAELVGLVKTSTPMPMTSRAIAKPLPFEDPRRKALVLEKLSLGFPVKTVLQAIGISAQSWGEWRRRGLRGLEPYASFLHEVEEAAAAGALGLLDDVRRSAEGAPDQHGVWKNKWEAARWLLEVGDPDQYKLVDKSLTAHVELTSPKQVDVRGMSEEDLEKLVDVLDRAPVIDVTPEET